MMFGIVDPNDHHQMKGARCKTGKACVVSGGKRDTRRSNLRRNVVYRMNGKSIKQARGKIGITTESALASTLSPMFCGPLARFVQVEEDLAALYLWRQLVKRCNAL